MTKNGTARPAPVEMITDGCRERGTSIRAARKKLRTRFGAFLVVGK